MNETEKYQVSFIELLQKRMVANTEVPTVEPLELSETVERYLEYYLEQ